MRAFAMAIKGDNPDLSDFDFSAVALRKYELNLANGIAKTDGSQQDHDNLMAAIDRIGVIPGGWPKSTGHVPPAEGRAALADAADAADKADAADIADGADNRVSRVRPKAAPLTMSQLLAKFFALKKKVTEGTVTDYTATVTEFDGFAKSPQIADIDDDVVTRYMEWAAKKGNGERTIDKKVGTLRALFNFAKKHKYFAGDNPAAERNLLTRKQRMAGGSKSYQLDDVKQIFACDEFKAFRQTEPNFHLIAVAGLVLGVRVSALAALLPGDFKTSIATPPTYYVRVRDDKTEAGKRDVPVAKSLYDALSAYVKQFGGMGFKAREDGKGASDPVRKLLDQHFEDIGVAHEDYTFHGLRKTLNNFLIQEGVSLEARCQFLGHEIDHVNMTVYGGEKFSIDKLAGLVVPPQLKLLGIIEF